jgi:hypothetical protein
MSGGEFELNRDLSKFFPGIRSATNRGRAGHTIIAINCTVLVPKRGGGAEMFGILSPIVVGGPFVVMLSKGVSGADLELRLCCDHILIVTAIPIYSFRGSEFLHPSLYCSTLVVENLDSAVHQYKFIFEGTVLYLTCFACLFL